VLRAGGGRFFTRLGVSNSIFLGGNPPFQPNASVSFGSVDNPGGSGTNAVPLVVTTQSKAFKNPEAWNWNITVERQLFWKSLLSVGYVGRRGLHLQREADINQPTTALVAANPGVNINALRPYKGFGSIRETDNVANSIYHYSSGLLDPALVQWSPVWRCVHLFEEHGQWIKSEGRDSRHLRSGYAVGTV